MNKKKWLLFGLMFVLLIASVALVGCSQEEEPEAPGTEGEGSAEETATGLGIELVDEWVASGHSKLVSSPAVEEDCVICHDGGAFAEQITDPAELERDWSVATDCRACHTGYGVEVAESGVVDIPTMDGFEAGKGALCASCHNGRRVPDPAAERRSAPHHSVQSDVLTASGGMPLQGVSYLVTDKHAEITDACVACHLDGSREGPPVHTFEANFGSCDTEECHDDPVDAEVVAAADYDGDGNAEAFQEEVQGLLDALDEALLDELAGGKYVAGQGQITFTDEASQTVTPTNELYAAAYNKFLIEYDASSGMHNPAFAVSLLQATYEAVTGSPSPGEPFNQSN